MATSARTALYAAVIKVNLKERIVIEKELFSDTIILPDFMEILSYILDKSATRLKTNAKQVLDFDFQ